MEIKVREAKKNDLPSVLGMLYQLSPLKKDEQKPEGYLAEKLGEIIADKRHILAVAELDGKIVGTAALLVQTNLFHGGRPAGHIENVVTDKSLRGKGVGKKLIKFLIRKAKKIDCYKVILVCERWNIPFYERCGFKETGETEMRMSLKARER